jgi:hypothetical protein
MLLNTASSPAHREGGPVSFTHESRRRRRPERGTTWPPDERPVLAHESVSFGGPSSSPERNEPGGSARENVPLRFELAVLTPQTLEFLTQPVRPVLVPISLYHPVADRLRGHSRSNV